MIKIQEQENQKYYNHLSKTNRNKYQLKGFEEKEALSKNSEIISLENKSDWRLLKSKLLVIMDVRLGRSILYKNEFMYLTTLKILYYAMNSHQNKDFRVQDNLNEIQV